MNDTETEFVLFKGKSTALDTELKLKISGQKNFHTQICQIHRNL